MRLIPLAVAFALSCPCQQPSSICHADFDGPAHDPAASYPSPAVLHAVRFTAPASLVASRVEIFTGRQSGPNRVSIFNHVPATGQPFLEIAAGTWAMSQIRGWQGANLTSGVALASGQTYWVGWQGVTGAQLSVTGGTASPQTYCVSYNGGVSFTSPTVGPEWKFRIYCGSPGHYFVFGAGCAGLTASTPELGWDRVPTTGATTRVLLEGGLPNDFAVLTLGYSNSVWNGTPLPFDLFAYGASGCQLRTSVLATLLQLTNPLGEAAAPLPMPPSPTYYGLQFYNQWFVHDPAANTLGFKVSNAGAGSLGL